MTRSIISTIFILLSVAIPSYSQTSSISGEVIDGKNNRPVPFATIQIDNTTIGSSSDENGEFEISGLAPGLYNIIVTFVGYEDRKIYEIQVTQSRPAFVTVEMEESITALDEIEIVASPFNKTEESPVSLRTIGINEIQRTPGGNRDISTVVRSLPGVASTPAFRNDIIIRGGAPSENKFYLDGIEIPTINHFQTQGSSGGPVGIVNVDFLKEVDFYSGAFPANRFNALSSVFDFKLKDGRKDRTTANITLGASDIGLVTEGPIGENSSFLFSIRRSYLQFIFKVLDLPFLPTYNDIQFKYKVKFNSNSQLTILGIGAYDDFELNFDANETDFQKYFLANLPVSKQWNYTIGAKYEHFRDNGFTTLVLSKNILNLSSLKYLNNDQSIPENKILDYGATEQEIKFRVEDYSVHGPLKASYGMNYERATYLSSNYIVTANRTGRVVLDSEAQLGFNKWGFYSQLSADLNDGKWITSIGVRVDANDYAPSMGNPLDQFSPRFSLSHNFNKNFSFNFNTGIYYQLPPYTTLGYTEGGENNFVNRENDLKYIESAHIVGGLEYNFKWNAISTVEGFYKHYDQYPFLLADSVTLANLGADFGSVGVSPATSTSRGRAYGLEWMYQQKLYKGFYGIMAYTWVRSQFSNSHGELIDSSWDNRHLVSITAGKKFKKNWEFGLRWLFSGGAPYTPYDLQATLLRNNWDVRNNGIPDYSRMNTLRGGNFHQLDIRLDKKYYLKNMSLDIYLDIQNVYNFVALGAPFVDVQKDAEGNPLTNPDDPNFYLPQFIPNENGTILPTVGVIVEF